MASIRLPDDEINIKLAEALTQQGTATYALKDTDYDERVIVIEASPELVIEFQSFREAVKSADRELGEAFSQWEEGMRKEWRMLILHTVGFITHFSEDEIIISDVAPKKTAGFLLRFPSEAEKQIAEEWSRRTGHDSLTAYMFAAMKSYNIDWEQKMRLLQNIKKGGERS
jgi:hypothetical protein